MSFGCSPSDVLKLLDMSTRVYLASKDTNENSEAQVRGLVKESTTFHGCLKELGGLMKQYGQSMLFSIKDFEDTLKKCEKTSELYADHLVDRKMSVKKFIFTLRIPSSHVPLVLAPPDEHPLFREWRIFDRWLHSEDERIAQEAGSFRPLSLGNTPAAAPSGDIQAAAILYQLRRQVDDAIFVQETRAKRATAEKRTHLGRSDAMKQKVRDMPPAPLRTHILETDLFGDFTKFSQELMSDSIAIIPSSLRVQQSSPDYSASVNWTQSPTSKSLHPDRTASSATRSSECYSPATQDTPLSPTLRHILSRTSLATMALGDAALDWKRICRTVQVERMSLKYRPKNRKYEVQ
ncbi:hypothetical protein G6011_01780 [Alternaria panax]|uniref:Uncharacterized protein n=1 Tax=Alternaria panax TaxID=48097 RepID=A0AAD4NW58_9PLEO|nr:hypothetical protein G6011_01780 [Alternaria panax]